MFVQTGMRYGKSFAMQETAKVLLCDSNCEHLTPKEKEQTNKKEDHRCNKYNKKLYHFNMHPMLYKCEECKNKP